MGLQAIVDEISNLSALRKVNLELTSKEGSAQIDFWKLFLRSLETLTDVSIGFDVCGKLNFMGLKSILRAISYINQLQRLSLSFKKYFLFRGQYSSTAVLC
eukprot:TRINITY_DN11026_c0_g1_i4.p1 TRINITY_DN11026_c0_g1~~TRINITY_DN11026_c0_g1_i4.p1  ORF type:complete len:101 (+),score=16.88 TRINITY_DN11026_c0_g1_i4:2-304(+)